MLKYLTSDSQAARLGAEHKVLLAQRQYLTAHQSGCARPTEQRHHCHKYVQSARTVNIELFKSDARNHKHRQGWHAVENINYTHYNLVNPLAEISRDTAEYYADYRFKNDNYKSDSERNSSAVHQTR